MAITRSLSSALIDGTGAITPANVTVSSNNLTVGNSFYVTSTGNVGIGTASPSQKLHVKDTNSFTTFILENANSTVQYTGPYLNLRNTAVSANYGEASLQHVLMNTSDLTDVNFQIQQRTIGGSFVNNIYGFSFKNQYHNWFTNGTERMRIDSSGNVGIGTSTSSHKLDVGDGTSASQLYVYGNVSGSKNSYVAMQDTSGTSIGFRAVVGGTTTMNLEGGSGSSYFNGGGNLGVGLVPTSRNNSRLQIVDGIGFPATQVASSDANTLDDYEEGSWTPVSQTTGISVTNIFNAGYTKIGRFVHAFCYVTINNSTASQIGNWFCGGLPFANGYGYGPAGRYYGTYSYLNLCYVEGGATYIIDGSGVPTGSSSIMLFASYFSST